ncbi:MAG: PfkB family carbohydrate kinase [Succinatimonas sp.]|nr:PfkB family carbohydrate kinase [Succinatimonas sp.]
MRILCVGISVLDRIFTLESLPKEEGKFFAKAFKEQGGGPAATAAVALARLGADVDMIARVGDDATGKAIVDELAKEGVGVETMRICKGAQSTQASIMVDKQGNRVIVSYPSPSLDPDPSFMDFMDFGKYDAILADVRWHEGTKKAFEIAKKLNIPTVLDADITNQSIDDLVSLATHSVFSKPGLLNYAKKQNIDEALEFVQSNNKGHMYVTLGGDGYKYYAEDNIICKASFKVDVVDTTGAGDVFHGAFAYGICTNKSIADVLKFSSAVSALKCTVAGGRTGIPNLKQVEAFLAEH